MQKRWGIIINVFVLFVLVLILLSMIWNFSFKENEIISEECTEINNDLSFVYDACYDAYSKTIFLKAKRGSDNYNINALDISFFDFTEKNYELSNVPANGSFKAYKIPAEKNPKNIDIRLNIANNSSLLICEEPKRVFIRYCPSNIGNKSSINISTNQLGNISFEDFIDIPESIGQDSDVFSLDLVSKEKIWKSKCSSSWNCGKWEPCVYSVQKRECKDVNKCFVPTDTPTTVIYCNNNCVEKWECEWSNCNNGFTTPNCKDLNNCGTSYNIPQKLLCEANKECITDIKCDEWSDCEVNYDFIDLVGDNVGNLYGIKSRVCKDKNTCAISQIEEKRCSISVDIYTKKFIKCGENFIGIYNKLNNDLIARIKDKTEINPSLNIYFRNEKDNEYCDYCFDGKKNGDEEEIDCGGSCKDCSDKYKQVILKKSLWEKFIDWLS